MERRCCQPKLAKGRNSRRRSLFFNGLRGCLQRSGGITLRNRKRDFAHFFMNQRIRRENHRGAKSIRTALKITDRATSLLYQENSRSGVPRLESKFPKAVEAPGGDAREIQCSGPVAAHSVRPQRKIVVVMNVRVGAPFVHRKSSAEQAGGNGLDFGERE